MRRPRLLKFRLLVASSFAVVVAASLAYGQTFSPVACQSCGPGAACQPPIAGVDCAFGAGCGEPHWNSWGPIPWQAFAQGEYTGPARLPHVPEYRLRVDDEIEFVYRLKREELSR